MHEYKNQNDWQHRQKQDSKPWNVSMPHAALKMKEYSFTEYSECFKAEGVSGSQNSTLSKKLWEFKITNTKLQIMQPVRYKFTRLIYFCCRNLLPLYGILHCLFVFNRELVWISVLPPPPRKPGWLFKKKKKSTYGSYIWVPFWQSTSPCWNLLYLISLLKLPLSKKREVPQKLRRMLK